MEKMHRFKKHRVKTEKPETSTSQTTPAQDYDLTYYIHDRVELMHQVFSVLKHKDLKAMAPDCVRHISIDDLQELCTEELLGISSKRLCAILDGAEPPSDTESSSESPERLETISLDSISSDEEILSVGSSKKNKKHKRHHRDRTKSKRSRRSRSRGAPAEAGTGAEGEGGAGAGSEQSRAARAGLTVLELLELQARARAIRAQLQQEQAAKQDAAAAAGAGSSDSEVEIKEEPAEVVEISSDEEKPDLARLAEKIAPPKDQPQSVTKRINDLIITVPQTKQSRKIKLNRSKMATHTDKTNSEASTSNDAVNDTPVNNTDVTNDDSTEQKAAKAKKKHKKKSKKVEEEKDSDHDEITLQLSDTEKMDLLEDLDRKNFENVSSSGSEDSESSSSDSSSEDEVEMVSDDEVKVNGEDKVRKEDKSNVNGLKSAEDTPASDKVASPRQTVVDTKEDTVNETTPCNDDVTKHSQNDDDSKQTEQKDDTESTKTSDQVKEPLNTPDSLKSVEVVTIDDIPLDSAKINSPKDENKNISEENKDSQVACEEEAIQGSVTEKELSEGELSDKESSEVEAFDLKPEVVCISDTEETTTKKKKKAEKKKKKEKKNKMKKSKKSKSDFRESADQNFYEETKIETEDNIKTVTKEVDKSEETTKTDKEAHIDITQDEKSTEVVIKNENTDNSAKLDEDYDDVYEILELSDDSSCYEVEGTVLSKEPTAEEIEALSAKIDEIEREDVVTEEEIREHERRLEEDIENVSWKDRYLDSKKVKRVLSTCNIFNALRKKNRELKKKLEESKKTEESIEPEKVEIEKVTVLSLEEGSIKQYNTLQGSTKYVDPVEEAIGKVNESDIEGENREGNAESKETPQMVKEMRKDAKQLLKMYKKLLKYNDMNKKKDPNKKKKKKSKKKNKDGGSAPVTST